LALIVTPLDSSSGRRAGSPSGGTTEVNDEYVTGGDCPLAAAVAGADEPGASDAAAGDAPGRAFGGGLWIAFRNVPLIAWPLNVTEATLFCLAWTRNAEYGMSIEVLAVGANRTNAFHASRTRKIPHQTRPGRPCRGVRLGPLGCGVGGAGGVGNVMLEA
jgi:hypothetical protein